MSHIATIKFFIISMLLIFCSKQTIAQNAPELNLFSVSEYRGQVYLAWELAAGSTCNGIRVERSDDGDSFTRIGNIYGVCGSFSEPVSYDFIDTKPIINKRSYYRLEMGKGFFSGTVSLEVINIQNGYHIRPNPVSNNGKIYFSNDSRLEHKIQIISPKGFVVHKASTNQDFFEINVESFQSGIYFFIISTANDPKKASGRFMVQQ